MAKKPGFTLARHEEIGAALHPIRQLLLELSVEIANAFPRKSPEAMAAERLVEAFDKLKCKLDDAVCRENPTVRLYKGHPLTSIYYRNHRD